MSKCTRLLVSVVLGVGALLVFAFGFSSTGVQAAWVPPAADDGTGEGGAAPVAPQAEFSTGAAFTITPQVRDIGTGQPFTVLLSVDNVTMTVKAWQVALDYDPAVVNMTGFTAGDLFAGESCTATLPSSQWQPTEGEMQFGVLCMDGDSGGKTSATLATLNMTALGAPGENSDLNIDIADVIITKLSIGGGDYYKPLATNLYHGLVNIMDTDITGLLASSDEPTVFGNATNFAASITGGTNVSYAWDFGDGVGTAAGANPSYTYPNFGTFTATVTATNNSLSSPQVATTTVRVQQVIAGLDATSSSPDIVGEITYFTATITSNPTGVTYAWDFGDGVGTGTGANPSYTYGAAGLYTAIVTATNALGDDTATTPVIIEDVPIAGLSASSSSPTPWGSPTQFTATITAGTGVAYDWDFGDGVGTDTGANPTYTYPDFGTFTATVTATNSSGSSVATTVVIVSSDPDISVPPFISATLNPDETTVQTLTIRNLGGATLNWNLTEGPPQRPWLDEAPTSGSIPLGGSEDVAVTFDSTGLAPSTYNSTLQITSDDPDEPTVNVPVTMTVNCVPVTSVDFDYTPSNPSAGDSVDFTAIVTPSNATPPIDYAWSFGDGGTGNGPTVAHTWSLSGTYSVAMTATNCSGAAVESHSEDVDVAGVLDITVSPLSLSTALNPDGSLTRTLVIENMAGATANLNWNLTENPPVGWLSELPANGTLGPGGSVNVDVVFDATGLPVNTYSTLLHVNSNDPDEPQVVVTATLVVTTACIPVEGVDFSYTPPAPQAGEEVTFFGSVTRGTEPVTYTWDFGGGNVATGSVVTYSWNLSGTYPVAVSAVNSCGSTGPTTNYVGVTGEPDITVAPLSLSASLETGGSTTRQLVIGNASAATADLTWNVTEVPDATWLSEAPDSGVASPGMSDTVTISFNAVGLSSGTYTATLRVGSNDPDQPTVDVLVTLTIVSCAPVSNADFTVSANPEVGEAVTFTGTVDAGSRQPIEFIFDFDDGTAPVSAWRYDTFYVVQHTYATSDTYHVVMTATNGCPSEDTVTHDVIVLGDPNIVVRPLSLSALLNPFVPAGQTSPRELIISNGAGATADLNWSLVEMPVDVSWLDVTPTSGVAPTSGSSSVNVTFNTLPNPGAGVHTATLRITSNDLDAPVVNVDVTLEVASGCIPVDGADFDFAPTGPITAGQTVVFTASVEQGSLPIDYTWDFGDGNSVVQNDVNAQTSIVTHVYTGTQEGYTVRLTASSNCGSSEDTVSKRVGNPIIYLPLVTRNYSTCTAVDITAPLESDSPVALGEMMHFTATVDGSTPIVYAWDFDGSGVKGGTDTNPTFTYDTVGAYTVTLVVTNACGTDSESIVVSVLTSTCTAPSIVGLTSDSPVTLGETVHFTTSVTGSAPITYTWDFDGAGTQGGDDANPTFTYDAAGIYVVRLDVANPCGTDTDVTLVTVNATRSSSSFVPAASLADAMLSLISRLPAFDAIVEADASQPTVDSGDASG